MFMKQQCFDHIQIRKSLGTCWKEAKVEEKITDDDEIFLLISCERLWLVSWSALSKLSTFCYFQWIFLIWQQHAYLFFLCKIYLLSQFAQWTLVNRLNLNSWISHKCILTTKLYFSMSYQFFQCEVYLRKYDFFCCKMMICLKNFVQERLHNQMV